MQINETKDGNRAYPMPTLPPERDTDYMTSLMAGAMLFSLMMRKTWLFFLVATVFISRCFVSDGTVNWMKAIIPMSGLLPAFGKVFYEIFDCIWNGKPL